MNSEARNVTAIALDAEENFMGKSHSLIASYGRIAKLELILDVPSNSTGTGTAMFMDGQDVAFVRAQLVDDQGVVVRGQDMNITYSVLSGPIRIVGVGSGNIRNHQAVQGHTYETWQGIGRVVVQATMDCTGQHRELGKFVDVDAPLGTYATSCPFGSFGVVVIIAKSGVLSATIEIPVSGAASDSPLEAARSNTVLDYTYFDDFN